MSRSPAPISPRATHERSWREVRSCMQVPAARCGPFPPRGASRVRRNARETLETPDLPVYMGAGPAAIHAGHAPSALCAIHAEGRRRVTWGETMSMSSRFGAGSDPDGVDFGDLEEAVGTNAWAVVDVREPHEF